MRWMHSVGMFQWCRILPDLKENLSGGVGFVRLGRFRMWNETWDFLKENRRLRDHFGGPMPQICYETLASLSFNDLICGAVLHRKARET